MHMGKLKLSHDSKFRELLRSLEYYVDEEVLAAASETANANKFEDKVKQWEHNAARGPLEDSGASRVRSELRL